MIALTPRLLSVGRWMIAWAILLTASASAQDRTGSVYLHGGLTLPQQEGVSGQADHQTYVAAPGGRTAGWLFGAGAFLVRHLSVEGEVASTGVMEARQPSRYGMTFNEERRERFFSGNLRAHLGGGGVQLEPVVGFTVVQGTQWSRTEYERLTPAGGTRTEVSDRFRNDLPRRYALSFGLDARIGGPRLAVVPSFRVHVASVPDEMVPIYPGGVNRWTFSPGVLARVEF